MTNKYKVGDTIYIKDTVEYINPTDTIASYRGSRNGWVANSAIIDELPTAEPVKPVLPKEVGEELDIAKNELQISFDVYIGNVIDSFSSAKASYHYYIVNTNAIIKLADAWRYGYTVEKEKKYNLILGTDGYDCIHAIRKCYDKDGVFIDDETYEFSNLQCDPDYQFTQEEIDKYNKDFWIKNLDLNDYKVEVVTDDSED